MTSIVKRFGACLASLVMGVAANAYAQPCSTHLAGVGPIDPQNGFPEYYIDSNDLALGSCLDLDCDPGLTVPDPTRPISFPDNFPVEFYYSRAVSKIDGSGPFKALYVAAVEGSFNNGQVPLAGDQVVFTRIRIRISPLMPFAEYTVTHPHGVNVLQADADGAIDLTEDVGKQPLDFEAAVTTGDVGPFLTFLDGPVPPGPGLTGNPGADQSVTGSSCGTNFFMIEGPGLPDELPAAFTDQFTLSGRKVVTCGNGVHDPFEDCDDHNTESGDCCSPTCGFESAGAPCAAKQCVDAMTCDGAGECKGGSSKAGPCDDGNACTSGDTCVDGDCVGGSELDCDDVNSCTTDECDHSEGCVHVANNLPCDDDGSDDGDDMCREGGTCVDGACVHRPVDCDDGNECTTDGCDRSQGCWHTSNSLSCDDGDACTMGDTCADGACVGGRARDCDDGNGCTTDSCDRSWGCMHSPNSLPCNDGDACTVGDTCTDGACVGAVPPCTASKVVGKVLADTSVDASAPTKNFGTATQLHVDAGPSVPSARGGLRRTFLRVQVSGVGSQRVSAAHLRLKVATTTNANSVTGGRIHRISSCGWNERTMTSATQPPIDGPVVSEVGAVGLGQTADFDVTSAITGDGVYCFAIESASTDGVDYLSREAKKGKPVLTVDASCACGAPSPAGTIEADVFASSAHPATNLGASPLLSVDSGIVAVERTFLRFRVSGVGGRPVASAHVQLQVSDVVDSESLTTGGSIHPISDCAWDERAVTWSNQPAIDGPALFTAGPVARGQVVDFDVTSAVSGDGVYCFALDNPTNDGADYNSREAASGQPALVIGVTR